MTDNTMTLRVKRNNAPPDMNFTGTLTFIAKSLETIDCAEELRSGEIVHNPILHSPPRSVKLAIFPSHAQEPT